MLEYTKAGDGAHLALLVLRFGESIILSGSGEWRMHRLGQLGIAMFAAGISAKHK
jgi:hypothetical protein